MEIYNSEEEQIEALKRWWDTNGTKVILALVVVLASVFGWRTWQNHKAQIAVAASAQYQTMLDAMDSDPKAAESAGKDVVVAHGDSVYAVLASLNLAKLAIGEKNYDEAAGYLKWVVEHADKPEYRNLAKVRLSQVELATGHKDKALAIVQDIDDSAGAFKPMFQEAAGDAYLAMGEREKAREAYTNALNGYPQTGGKRSQLQMKLENLAAAAAKDQG